ncbi:ATP dependent DNA ligase-like protein [Rhizobium sp. ERR 1071]|nr:ATP dependent DNA ligase-like protein [Rhizobium sp. ERR1071]
MSTPPFSMARPLCSITRGTRTFGALQRSLVGRGGKRAPAEAVIFAFDPLYFNGHDLTGMELSVRRHLPEDSLDGAAGAIQLRRIRGDGAALLAKACSRVLERMIAKHWDRPYRCGRTGDWIKIKCVQSKSLMIVGYEQSASARGASEVFLLPATRDATGSMSVGGNRLRCQGCRLPQEDTRHPENQPTCRAAQGKEPGLRMADPHRRVSRIDV